MAIPKRHYTVARLADEWECSQKHVYNLMSRGDLKFLKIGSLTRIPKEFVEEYERENICQNLDSEDHMDVITGTSVGQKVENLSARLHAQNVRPEQSNFSRT